MATAAAATRSVDSSLDGIGAIHATGGGDRNVGQLGFAAEQASVSQLRSPGLALGTHLLEGPQQLLA